MTKCRALKEYSIFVSLVREKYAEGQDLSRAIKDTIRYCQQHDILKEFLAEKAMEVQDMVNFKWDLEEAKKVWFKEGVEEGIEKGLIRGLEKGRLETALELLKSQFDAEVVAKATKLSLEKVNELARANKLI
ncbi:MAG: hypothetical protein PHQ44_02070 [Anaerovibrio sp.]|nr:hypothetical protein [Anaerovibrio sp.]